MILLDLSELDSVFSRHWLWSTSRPAPCRFRRSDHPGDPETPLDETIRSLVETRTGERPNGRVLLLTQLRYFGFVFNPVTFYWCYADDEARKLHSIVADVHNTPWNERHLYVFGPSDDRGSGRSPVRRFRFPKQFHVSPFMPMNQDYVWRFSEPGEHLFVHMDNFPRRDSGGRIRMFDATLEMERHPITSSNLARALTRHPWMTAKVLAGIYWQAFRLWRKGAPYHRHPDALAAEAAADSESAAARLDANSTELPDSDLHGAAKPGDLQGARRTESDASLSPDEGPRS